MTTERSPTRAVAWMLLAVACFSLMDAGMKQLSSSYPTLQVTFLRGAASLPFVLVWVLATAGPRSLVPVRWACTCCAACLAWR
jgi:drug/metabolite transporter (DMT)-like permease